MSDTRPDCVLRWLGKVLEAHRLPAASRGGRPVLISTLLPERERWMDLIGELFAVAEGVVVDATKSGLGVNCGDVEHEAPALVESVRSFLDDYNKENSDAKLVLHISTREARIEGTSAYGSSNAAQVALREVLTAVLSDDLRSSPLVALVYAEDALDPEHIGRVWELLMQLPELLNMQEEATLAVAAGDSAVRFDIHCEGQRSLRFRLDGDRLLERHPWKVSMAKIGALAKNSPEDMPLLVLFLGSGASAADRLPTGDTLRNRALAYLTGRQVDAGTWRTVAAEWFQELAELGCLQEYELRAGVDGFVNSLTLERVLEQEQADEGQRFSKTLRDFSVMHGEVFTRLVTAREDGELASDPIRSLTRLRRRIVLVTVNFDQLIEARAGEDVRPFVSEGELGDFPAYLTEYLTNGGPVPLLKLHGDIEYPETLVANIDETMAGLSRARDSAINALIDLVAAFNVPNWWYVGYSMRDRDLETTWSSSRFLKFNEHWVAPFLDPSVERFIDERRVKRWREAGWHRTAQERLLSLTARDFFEVLSKAANAGW